MTDKEKEKEEEEEEIEDDLEDEEVDDKQTDGNEGVDDSNVGKDEKVVEEQQDKDIAEKDTEDIYNKEDAKEQLAEDEITPAEAGFMEGYENSEEGICSTCGKSIDPEKTVEKEVNGKMFTFCSDKCADYFERRKAGLR